MLCISYGIMKEFTSVNANYSITYLNCNHPIFIPFFLTFYAKHQKTALKRALCVRWVSVVEFHDGALSIGKVFGQESTVVKWNYQILSLHLVTVCQKVPILDFQSEFSMSKIIWIFLKKNSLKNINLGAPLVKSIFCWLQFQNHFITKMRPNFWRTVTKWRLKIW